MTKTSSLSAGALIRQMLLDDADVAAITREVFPVVYPVEEVNLPYISYRRSEMTAVAVKASPSADTVIIEIDCCAGSYAGSVELAEAVRTALDGRCGTDVQSGLSMRSCFLSGGEELYEADAFIQRLVFTMKINRLLTNN